MSRAFSVPRQEGQSLVSLAPNLTEIVFALGLEKNLVGVTDQCDFPAQAKKIEKVGTYGKPVLEAILAKKPTFVLATEGVDKGFVESLERKKISVLKFQSRSLNELENSILMLGEKLQASDNAKKIVSSLERKRQTVLQLPRSQKTYLVIIGGSPLFSVNHQTLLAEIINLTGLKNLVETSSAYPQLSQEYFLSVKPDVVFVTQGVLQEARVSEKDGDWEKKLLAYLSRGRYKLSPRIVALPPDVFERAGPRLVEAMSFIQELRL